MLTLRASALDRTPTVPLPDIDAIARSGDHATWRAGGDSFM
jgi:hypothetical protein